MPDVSLSELVAQFRSLNPTDCTTQDLVDLQHRMGTLVIDDPGMKRLVGQLFLLDAAKASDEDISFLQSQMGLALERLENAGGDAKPDTSSEERDPTMDRAAREWITQTAKAMGVADEQDGLFLQTRGLAGWMHEQMETNKQHAKAMDILRSLLDTRGLRTDGDAVALAERCKLLALEDKELLDMRQTNIDLLKERLAKAQGGLATQAGAGQGTTSPIGPGGPETETENKPSPGRSPR